MPGRADRKHKKKRQAAQAAQTLLGTQQQPQLPSKKQRQGSDEEGPDGEIAAAEPGVTWEVKDGQTLVTMRQREEVLLMGQAELRVLEGAVCVNGKVVQASHTPTKISTAGRTGPAITLRAEPVILPIPLVSTAKVKFSLTAPKPQLTSQPPPGGCIMAAAAKPRGRKGDAGGPGPEAGAGTGGPVAPSPGPASRFVLHLSDSPTAPSGVRVPADWQEAIESICYAADQYEQGLAPGPVIVAVCGAKGMGKSSLGRLLANNLLNCCPAVMYLDTDCGQPEFTPPGLVSLTRVDGPVLGPSCTHLRTPLASFFLGDTSAQADPETYCAAVQSLVHSYWQQGPDPQTGLWAPLLINTHGWIKGVGLDVLAEVLSAAAPTHVVQFLGDTASRSLPSGLFWLRDPSLASTAAAGPGHGPGHDARTQQIAAEQLQAPCALIHLAPAGSAPPAGSARAGQPSPGPATGGGGGGGGGVAFRPLKASDARGMLWHAWARAVAGRDGTWGLYEGEELWQDAGRLAAVQPLVVSLDDVTVRFLYEQDLPRSQLGFAINGAIVGLACSSGAPSDATAGAGRRGGALPPPAPPPCLGLGVVRAVDMEAGLLYLLTDLALQDEARLQSVDTLLVGKLELPSSLLQASDASVSPYVTLFSVSAEGTGAGGARSRPTLERNRLK